jgi:hypothetical protein
MLDFYARHSPITNPGRHSRLLRQLPPRVDGVARVVQGLIMHPAAAKLYGERPEPDNPGWGYRTMAETLERILAINAAPLEVPRPARQRLRVNCRTFAVLFVSMLRHQGVPARRRVGFARYLPGRHSYTHEIAEYWSTAQARWVLVDPQNDAPTVAAQRAFFDSIGQSARADYDTLDVRPGVDFVFGGEAWRQCRAGAADPDEFRCGRWRGLHEVALTVQQDLDGLNKAEMLSNESGLAPDEELTSELTAFLDRVAALTADPDRHFDELRDCYARSSYGRSMLSKLYPPDSARVRSDNLASLSCSAGHHGQVRTAVVQSRRGAGDAFSS